MDQLKRGAQRDSDLIVKEAELKAEEILSQSRAELVEMRVMILSISDISLRLERRFFLRLILSLSI